MSVEVLDKDHVHIELGVRLDNSDDRHFEAMQQCVMTREHLVAVTGLALFAKQVGKELDEVSCDDLLEGQAQLATASALVEAELVKLDDFPRWPIPYQKIALGL